VGGAISPGKLNVASDFPGDFSGREIAFNKNEWRQLHA
jgi:hypothetical protein